MSTVEPATATPAEIDALRAALLAAEARASGAEAMVAHLKLLIAKLKHDRFGASSERGRKLLEIIGDSFPVPSLSEAYFDNLALLLRDRPTLDQPGRGELRQRLVHGHARTGIMSR